MVPVYIYTLREFDGTDPWDYDRPARWSVAGYRMVHPRFVKTAMLTPAPPVDPASGNAVPGKFLLGVVARATGRYRILPRALQKLWRAGKVRDEDVPWLLHQVEGRLHRSDYPGSMLVRFSLVMGLLLAIYALCGFAAWYFLTPRSNHVTQFIPEAPAWLDAAMQGESGVEIKGKIPALDKTVEITSLAAPAGLHGRQLDRLFVVQAAHEKRLVLAGRAAALTDPEGAVVRTATAAIPADAVRRLKESYPDLNTTYALCTGWEWDDAVSPYRAGEFAWLSSFAIWCGPAAAILLGLCGFFWWRKRTQQELWAALIAGRHTGVNV